MDTTNDKPKHPIQQFREQRGLSQQNVADQLNCSQTLISLIEAGERPVSRDAAPKWEAALGIPRNCLLYPDEYPYDARAHAATTKAAA